MSFVQGVVQQISRRGNATNIRVNDQWFGCGFNGVPCAEGDTVSFTVTQNGKYVNANMDAFQVVQQNQGVPNNGQQNTQVQGNNQGYAGGGARNSGPRRGSGGGSSPSRGGYRKDLTDPVQVSITQQSARNAAIELVKVALQHDACPLPAKKADKFDALLDLVDTVAERYYLQTTEVAKAGGYKATAEGAKPQQASAPVQDQAGAPADDFDDDIPFD